MERSQIERLDKRIEELEADIEGMRESRSWQALVAAVRLLGKFEDQREALIAEAESSFDATSIEEIVSNVVQLADDVFAHPKVQARALACR